MNAGNSPHLLLLLSGTFTSSSYSSCCIILESDSGIVLKVDRLIYQLGIEGKLGRR